MSEEWQIGDYIRTSGTGELGIIEDASCDKVLARMANGTRRRLLRSRVSRATAQDHEDAVERIRNQVIARPSPCIEPYAALEPSCKDIASLLSVKHRSQVVAALLLYLSSPVSAPFSLQNWGTVSRDLLPHRKDFLIIVAHLDLCNVSVDDMLGQLSPSDIKTLETLMFMPAYTAHKRFILILSSFCLLYTSPSPRDAHESRMPSSA